MIAVKITILHYTDNSQRGWVECNLIDVEGQEWLFIEKVPIVTSASLNGFSNYPQPGSIACQIIDRRVDIQDRETLTIDMSKPWSIESTSGNSYFEVYPNQLLDVE